jgi:hypothetical protein
VGLPRRRSRGPPVSVWPLTPPTDPPLAFLVVSPSAAFETELIIEPGTRERVRA